MLQFKNDTAAAARRARRSGLAAGLLALAATGAWAADEAAIERGLEVYRTTAGCQHCHGWTGTGGIPGDEGAAGPSLVKTPLDRKAIVEVVACGRPGTGMPRHASDAYSDARSCYGLKAADVAKDDMPPAAERRFLRRQEIEDVATYVVEVYQGKEMTLQTCERFFGAGARQCMPWRK